MKKIGILASNTNDNQNNTISNAYIQAVESCKNVIVYIIPCKTDNMDYYIKEMDGFLVPGGQGDIAPSLYGEKVVGSKDINIDSDNMLIETINKIFDQGKRILGICRGMQIINVALGGSLIQDIPNTEYSFDPIHDVKIEKDSLLYSYFNTHKIKVNSLHHQGIKQIGKGLRSIAYNEQGIIEAFEDNSRNILGIQRHPEYGKENMIIFKEFFVININE